MKVFKPTVVAATISVALASIAVDAAPTDRIQKQTNNVSFNQERASFDAAVQKQLASMPTVTGMQS
ncbi:hypothetical protein [Glaciecola sp. KUL10]|uniref:hypothetical protein n=1 Tax=Glaciecola sp. (strain KUL10) TaxID=2161813 RepID=UPI000D78235E|nr:hypothetical protein [Glaciecola sp. KUL10]GBL05139.1 hypothetical protein KUL10_24590 [Glaciecola sp. KUL10]